MTAPDRHDPPASSATDDPYLWLEEVDGAPALDWVAQRNRAAEQELEAQPGHAALCDRLRAILDSCAAPAAWSSCPNPKTRMPSRCATSS